MAKKKGSTQGAKASARTSPATSSKQAFVEPSDALTQPSSNSALTEVVTNGSVELVPSYGSETPAPTVAQLKPHPSVAQAAATPSTPQRKEAIASSTTSSSTRKADAFVAATEVLGPAAPEASTTTPGSAIEQAHCRIASTCWRFLNLALQAYMHPVYYIAGAVTGITTGVVAEMCNSMPCLSRTAK